MDDSSPQRAAKNEALTRSLNEGLARGEEKWPSEQPTFICECSDLSCVQEIVVSLEDYRSIHEERQCFIVRPGHETPEIETIVEERDGFHVVEKMGTGRDMVH
ncbi:MAG TPA: hypothetical protein VG929_04755 [Actinomycetota bacterium]|nr:hypothetical protein [Actinomycetota bacterium]